jgi:hypothetical protein
MSSAHLTVESPERGVTIRRTVMRKVALQMYVTLDGVMEAPQNWSFDCDGGTGAPSAAQGRTAARLCGPARPRPSGVIQFHYELNQG